MASGSKDEGSVFIEDGPYNGRQYVNEAEFDRYRCLDCKQVFGPMPARLLCTKCGGAIFGEVGEDCDQDPEHEGEFLCEDCMKSGGPDE